MAVDIKQSIADPISRDLGNKGVQGRLSTKTVQLALFTSNENAVWAGNRILAKESYPFGMFRLTVNRKAFRLEPGDCFRFFYAPYGIQGVVCRVAWVEEEDPTSERINVYAIEDWSEAARQIEVYAIPSDRTIGRIDYTVFPFEYQNIIEAPFILSDEVGIVPLACRSSSQDLGFEVYMSLDGGASYSFVEKTNNLFPFGLLVGSYPSDTYTIDTTTGFVVDFVQDAQLIESSVWPDVISGQINLSILLKSDGVYEAMTFKDITPVSESRFRISNIVRGRLGTAKQDHAEGERFYVLGLGADVLVHPEITTGATRHFKFVPYNRKQIGDISECGAIEVSMKGAVFTPYRPTNFAANNQFYASRYDNDIVLTWSSRHRRRGAGIGLPGKVVPSADWEGLYRIEVWVGGVRKRTASDIDALTWTYTEAMNIEDNGSLAPKILFKLFNYRFEDGFTYESDPSEVTCQKN